MQPIQINVSVTIGVSQELKGLLLPLVAQLPPVEVPEPKPAKKKVQPAVENPKPAADPAPAAEPEEKPAPEPVKETEQPAKEYTEVDVRAAMDAARRRIEGEGWKENPTSEGYKKWHRVLTAWFKNTAAECGAEKPSALPDSESRRKFIACCEAVFVNDADELVSDLPQF